MSKNRLLKTIHTELEKINEQIDLKIIRGMSYKRESMRHKFLISHLTQAIRKSNNTNWMQRTAHMVSSFLL